MAIPAVPKRYLEVTLKTGEVRVFPLYTDSSSNEHWQVIKEEIGMDKWANYNCSTVPPSKIPVSDRTAGKQPKYMVLRTKLVGEFKSDVIRFFVDEEEMGGWLRRMNTTFRDSDTEIMFTYRKIGEPDVRIIDFNGYLRTLR